MLRAKVSDHKQKLTSIKLTEQADLRKITLRDKYKEKQGGTGETGRRSGADGRTQQEGRRMGKRRKDEWADGRTDGWTDRGAGRSASRPAAVCTHIDGRWTTEQVEAQTGGRTSCSGGDRDRTELNRTERNATERNGREQKRKNMEG